MCIYSSLFPCLNETYFDFSGDNNFEQFLSIIVCFSGASISQVAAALQPAFAKSDVLKANWKGRVGE